MEAGEGEDAGKMFRITLVALMRLIGVVVVSACVLIQIVPRGPVGEAKAESCALID